MLRARSVLLSVENLICGQVKSKIEKRLSGPFDQIWLKMAITKSIILVTELRTVTKHHSIILQVNVKNTPDFIYHYYFYKIQPKYKISWRLTVLGGFSLCAVTLILLGLHSALPSGQFCFCYFSKFVNYLFLRCFQNYQPI